MADTRRGGILFAKLAGKRVDVQGEVTYNLGEDLREAIVGSDTTHGFATKPQVAFCEFEITDSSDLKLTDILNFRGPIQLELANTKMITFANAWYAGSGNVTSEKAKITARFEAVKGIED